LIAAQIIFHSIQSFTSSLVLQPLQRLDRNDVEHHKEVTVIFLADASG